MPGARPRTLPAGTRVVVAYVTTAPIGAAPTRTQASDGSPLDATAPSLYVWAQHAANQRCINTQGRAPRLLAELDAAPHSVARSQPSVEAHQALAFLHAVEESR